MILPKTELGILLVLGLAVFRLTRLIVFDKIMEPFRRPFFTEIEEKDEQGKVEIYLIPKEKGIRSWIGELLSCYWCTGFWVSLCLTSPLYDPFNGWRNVYFYFCSSSSRFTY